MIIFEVLSVIFDILAIFLNSAVILIYLTHKGELQFFRHFIGSVAVLDLLCAILTLLTQPIFVSQGNFGFMLTSGPLSSFENSQFLIVGYSLVYYFMILMLMNSFICRYVVLHQNRLSFLLRKPKIISILVILEFLLSVNIAIGFYYHFGSPNASAEALQAAQYFLDLPYAYAYLAWNMEPSEGHICGWLYLLQSNFVIIGATVLSGYCTLAISRSTGYGRVSQSTRKMHRKLLYSLIIQLALTLGFLAVPIIPIYLFPSLEYGIDRNTAHWLSSTFPLAPCINPIVVFIFVKDYRNHFWLVFCSRAKKNVAVGRVERTAS